MFKDTLEFTIKYCGWNDALEKDCCSTICADKNLNIHALNFNTLISLITKQI